MFIESLHIGAIYVYKLTAFNAFQMKMLITIFIRNDILVACACFIIKKIFSYNTVRNKLVQITIDSCSANVFSIIIYVFYYFSSSQMTLFIFQKEIQNYFLLLCFVISWTQAIYPPKSKLITIFNFNTFFIKCQEKISEFNIRRFFLFKIVNL